jgi:polar amino acid transport system substrate-binding protein
MNTKQISRRTFLSWSTTLAASMAVGGCGSQATLAPTATVVPTVTIPAKSSAIRITNGEWAPFMSETLPNYGFGSRIVTEAFALEGVEIEYGFFPWARALEIAKTGEWDGSIGWSRSEERDKQFYISDTLFIARNLFFYLKEQPFEWQSYEDLKGMTIGANIGYSYGEAFEKAEKDGLIKVERVPTEEDLLKMLLAKHLQVVMVSEYVGYYLLKTKFTVEEGAKVAAHSKSTRDSEKSLLLSKQVPKNEMRITVFNQGLAKLKTSGKYDQYLTNALKGEY